MSNLVGYAVIHAGCGSAAMNAGSGWAKTTLRCVSDCRGLHSGRVEFPHKQVDYSSCTAECAGLPNFARVVTTALVVAAMSAVGRLDVDLIIVIFL